MMIDPQSKSNGQEAQPLNRQRNTAQRRKRRLTGRLGKVKSMVLLTIALFLISAPAPDSDDIAEMTSNFIVPAQAPGLQASQEPETREALSRHITAQARDQKAEAETETIHPKPAPEHRNIPETDPPLEV